MIVIHSSGITPEPFTSIHSSGITPEPFTSIHSSEITPELFTSTKLQTLVADSDKVDDGL